MLFLSLAAKESVHFIGQVLHKCIICLNISSQFQNKRKIQNCWSDVSSIGFFTSGYPSHCLWISHFMSNYKCIYFMGSTDTHTTTQRQFTSLQLPTYALKYNFSLKVLHKPDFLRQVLGAYLLSPEQLSGSWGTRVPPRSKPEHSQLVSNTPDIHTTESLLFPCATQQQEAIHAAPSNGHQSIHQLLWGFFQHDMTHLALS